MEVFKSKELSVATDALKAPWKVKYGEITKPIEGISNHGFLKSWGLLKSPWLFQYVSILQWSNDLDDLVAP
jgi:hypothetical protein